jgi:DNA-binding transcriptional ArsR family regulator
MKSLYATEIKAEAHQEVKHLLWFVFAGTRGGISRIKIVSLIKDRPINTNQLSREIGIDYKAIQHHIKVLEKNNLITDIGERYGKTFFLSSLLESNIKVLDEIITKLKKSIKKFSGDAT